MKNYLLSLVGIGCNLLIFAYCYTSFSDDLLFWQTWTRLSGRVSFLIFACLFVQQTLLFFAPQRAFKSVAFVSKNMFMAFLITHGIHLYILANYIPLSGNFPILARALGGIFAYILVFAVPILEYFMIENKWLTRLKFLYIYWLGFVMFMTYFPRVQGTMPQVGGTWAEHLTLLICTLALFFFHLFHFLRRQRTA